MVRRISVPCSDIAIAAAQDAVAPNQRASTRTTDGEHEQKTTSFLRRWIVHQQGSKLNGLVQEFRFTINAEECPEDVIFEGAYRSFR